MEEETRRVRAHSNDTGRPYFSINYKLSLSAKDLLQLALDEMEVIDSDYGDPTPLPPPPPFMSSTAERRNSGFDNATSFLKVAELAEKAPGTPTSQYRERKRAVGPPTTSHIPSAAGKKSNAEQPKTVRRTKSAMTMAEIELNRSAPPAKISFSINDQSKEPAQNMLPGFVTCLNSRNVGKYKVGQKYRDGIVVGIDDEHGKIIVYNENMPRGALTVLKTRDAARYDKGFILEDVRGNFLGSVHAVDRVQNLLVLNTTPPGSASSNNSPTMTATTRPAPLNINSAPSKNPPPPLFTTGVKVT